jgi:hypothetical protein
VVVVTVNASSAAFLVMKRQRVLDLLHDALVQI